MDAFDFCNQMNTNYNLHNAHIVVNEIQELLYYRMKQLFVCYYREMSVCVWTNGNAPFSE